MAKIAGVDVPDVINKAVGGVLTDAAFQMVLTRVTPGARGVDVTAGNNPTTTTHACRGVITSFAIVNIDGTNVIRGDRIITLLANSIVGRVAPKANDLIAAEGKSYRVVSVIDRDAAAATYTLQVRGA